MCIDIDPLQVGGRLKRIIVASASTNVHCDHILQKEMIHGAQVSMTGHISVCRYRNMLESISLSSG